MRINEITNSTEKIELLRMIDAAIWQAMDAESAYADDDDASNDTGNGNVGKGVAATPTANQVAPKPIVNKATAAKPATTSKPTATPVKSLNPQQLAQAIKNIPVKQTAVPTTATPVRPNINLTPAVNNSNNVPNGHFDTFNTKNDATKNKANDTADRHS